MIKIIGRESVDECPGRTGGGAGGAISFLDRVRLMPPGARPGYGISRPKIMSISGRLRWTSSDYQ
ncbi:hypothetical protein OHQ88_17760 [Micromonospora zamorensis]|uniref:Uncharacterized protein n=1 Tax=Micromonospora zamorensis TaxID=709883 RepID=A0ABZ1P7A6_9ACTN